MKIATSPSPILDTLTPPRSDAATGRPRSAESFPEALRGASAARERAAEPEVERPESPTEGEIRSSETSEDVESARAGDRKERPESTRSRRETATVEAEDEPRAADPPGTGSAARDVPAAMELLGTVEAMPVPMDPLPAAAIAPIVASPGSLPAGLLAAAAPIAGTPVPSGALPAEAPAGPALGGAPGTVPTAAAPAAEGRADPVLDPRTAPAPKGAPVPGEANAKNEAAAAVAAARRGTNEGAAGSVVVAGSMGAEGESASVPARGAAFAAAPAAPRPGDPSWFDRTFRSDRGAPDRAAFHLLAEGAESPDELRAPSPITSAVRASLARGAGRMGGEASAEAIAPAPTAVATSRAEANGSTSAPAPAADVSVSDPGEPSELARRIHRLVRRSLARGEHELRIRLDPPRLGRVEVEMSVDERRLGIRFTVESEEVRDTLKTHLADLHRSLGEHGFAAESVEIDLRQDGSGAERPAAGSANPTAGGGEDGGDPAPTQIRLRHLGRTVDLRG